MKNQGIGRSGRAAIGIYALLLSLAGLALAAGGCFLITLGGSAYYLLAGLAMLASGVLLGFGRAAGVWLYGLLWLLSLAWAIGEVGFDGWALAPRLITLALLGLGLLMPWVQALQPPRHAARLRLLGALGAKSAAWVAMVVAVALGAALHCLGPKPPPDPLYRSGTGRSPASVATASSAGAAQDWPHYGSDAGGSRFSRLAQITPANVAGLRMAWTYRTGDLQTSLEVTPLKVDDSLYLCTGANEVIALDADTGTLRWRFRPYAAQAAVVLKACRGVAYYRVPNAVGDCAERILTNTVDARLIALDARTGQLCKGFGRNGQVSLLTGMADASGRIIPGYYFVTSAPTIVRGRVVLGGWVSDDQYWGEPSGVIRAFDAVTGGFSWAFDMGRPDRQSEPPSGERYTPSTPNSWAPMSADEELGLVYAPTGNTSGADYYGALRRPFDEKYSSSVVAIDAESGRVRWSFQTVHHDLWDYDVAPQPVLIDIARQGGTAQALIQATKTGEIFVLDRATGAALFEVTEAPAPSHGAVAGEPVAATQPASAALPSFRGPDLQERDMWGITPFDQLWCRIRFKQARYQGIYTPPGVAAFIQYPGILGGIEWSSVSVNPERGLMMVNASRVANYAALIPRSDADATGRKPQGLGGSYMHRAQLGTPYAVSNPPFLSPLGVPCQRPPFGTLSAVDLSTGKLVWTRWLGTARDSGPLGIPSMLPFPLGTPTLGGSVSTRSGLVFIAATQDRYLRAYEAGTGALLWKDRLPAAGLATPMTYLSARSGRQFVVIAAGGGDARLGSKGDYIIAYALPK